MSIWGSLIGGMIGFSLGGPFGMLLGSLLGGKISRSRTRPGFRASAQSQRIFALSLIVLSAKLSKADGQVSREELIAVKDKLKIPENEKTIAFPPPGLDDFIPAVAKGEWNPKND